MIFQEDFSPDVVVTLLVPRASDLAHIVWRAGDSRVWSLVSPGWGGLARTNNRHQPRPGPGAGHQPQ